MLNTISTAMAVLNEARLEEIISSCERSGDWASLKQRYTTVPFYPIQVNITSLVYSLF